MTTDFVIFMSALALFVALMCLGFIVADLVKKLFKIEIALNSARLERNFYRLQIELPPAISEVVSKLNNGEMFSRGDCVGSDFLEHMIIDGSAPNEDMLGHIFSCRFCQTSLNEECGDRINRARHVDMTWLQTIKSLLDVYDVKVEDNSLEGV